MRAGTWSHHTDTGVVSDRPCVLERLTVGTAASTETATVHDCAEVGDATADNTVAVVDLGVTGSWEFGAVMGRGCVVVVSGGAPDFTIVRS